MQKQNINIRGRGRNIEFYHYLANAGGVHIAAFCVGVAIGEDVDVDGVSESRMCNRSFHGM